MTGIYQRFMNISTHPDGGIVILERRRRHSYIFPPFIQFISSTACQKFEVANPCSKPSLGLATVALVNNLGLKYISRRQFISFLLAVAPVISSLVLFPFLRNVYALEFEVVTSAGLPKSGVYVYIHSPKDHFVTQTQFSKYTA